MCPIWRHRRPFDPRVLNPGAMDWTGPRLRTRPRPHSGGLSAALSWRTSSSIRGDRVGVLSLHTRSPTGGSLGGVGTPPAPWRLSAARVAGGHLCAHSRTVRAGEARDCPPGGGHRCPLGGGPVRYCWSARRVQSGLVCVHHGAPTSGRLLLVVLRVLISAFCGESVARRTDRLRVLATWAFRWILCNQHSTAHRRGAPGVSGVPESVLFTAL